MSVMPMNNSQDSEKENICRNEVTTIEDKSFEEGDITNKGMIPFSNGRSFKVNRNGIPFSNNISFNNNSSVIPFNNNSNVIPFNNNSNVLSFNNNVIPFSNNNSNGINFIQFSNNNLRSPLQFSNILRSPLQLNSNNLRSPLQFSNTLRSPLQFSNNLRSPLQFSNNLRSPLIFRGNRSSLMKSPYRDYCELAGIVKNFNNIMHKEQIQNFETCCGCLHSERDCNLIIEKIRKGELMKIKKRLNPKEKSLIRPGSIFVYAEEDSNIKRWTDKKEWSPSRVQGCFLIYKELQGSLMKKTFASNQIDGVYHIVAYTLIGWDQQGKCCENFLKNEKNIQDLDIFNKKNDIYEKFFSKKGDIFSKKNFNVEITQEEDFSVEESEGFSKKIFDVIACIEDKEVNN